MTEEEKDRYQGPGFRANSITEVFFAVVWGKNAIVYYLVKLLRFSEPVYSSIKWES